MRSESARDERRRRGAALLVSLVLHAGLVLLLARSHPEHPFPGTTEPIPVALLREPVAEVAPDPAPPPMQRATAPRPPPPKPKTEARPPEREREAPPLVVAPPPPAAPDPPPAPAPVTGSERGEPDESRPLSLPSAEPQAPSSPPAPRARDFTRVFSEAEVDRTATARRPIRASYPERERARGRESSVVVILTIGADGRVDEVEILESGGGAFDRAALRALRSARFAPAVVAGRPVASELRYRLRFALR